MAEIPKDPEDRGRNTPKPASNKKVANGVVALSSAAVLAVYTAGYVKTKAAAERLEAASQRRPYLPMPAASAAGHAPVAAANLSAVQSAGAPDSRPAHADAVAPETAAVLGTDAERTLGSSPPGGPSSGSSPTSPRQEGTVAMTAGPQSEPASTEPVAVVAKAEAASNAPALAPVAIPVAGLPVQQTERPAAPVTPPATPAPAASPAASGLKDGKYLGWGYSRHGDIQAQVVIENGRIAYAVIAKCQTRWSCSIIEHLQKQVGQRQSPEVDYVAGATDSANAFYGAVVQALKQAR